MNLQLLTTTLTWCCEDLVRVGSETGGYQHRVYGQGEHHVGDGQGDDEDVRGRNLLSPQEDYQDHQQVEQETHKN